MKINEMMLDKMDILNYKFIDLSHTLDENIPSWDGGCGFKTTTQVDYEDCTTEVKFRVQALQMHSGIGTHIDAPAHCIQNGLDISQIPIQDLISPSVVIDVSANIHERYSVTLTDVKNFERKYGNINPKTLVLIKTGWDKYCSEPEKYKNNYVFPSVSKEACEYLLEKKIIGLGIDALSPDRPEDGYPVHQTLLGAGRYIIENIMNLNNMPIVGGFVLALPLKIKGGTESPLRLIGIT